MRARLRLARSTFVVLSVLALVACGGGDGGGGDGGDAAGTTLTVEAGEFYFEPDSLTADAGSITVELDNQGEDLHNFVVEEIDETVAEAQAGSTDSGSTELEAGSYVFYCDVPGHRDAGMEGTLEVG